MKIIEFVAEKNSKFFSPYVILIDCSDISCFEQIEKDDNRCKLITKNKISYILYGSYKTITNRYFYALSKKYNLYEDDIIRPSIKVFHRPNLLEIDTAFFDSIQLKGFIFGLNKNFNIDVLPDYTKEVFLKENI